MHSPRYAPLALCKLDRMAIAGGDFRKGGSRSRGSLKHETLSKLLEDDIRDFSNKNDAIEDVKIEDDELDDIMDRGRLFTEGAIKPEGRMYDVLESKTESGVLSTVS